MSFSGRGSLCVVGTLAALACSNQVGAPARLGDAHGGGAGDTSGMAGAPATSGGGAAAGGAAAEGGGSGTGMMTDAGAAGAATAGAAGSASPRVTALVSTSGWQVYPAGSYHYGPSIVVDDAGTIHMWTCSPGAGKEWDHVHYHSSTDQGHTWTPDVIALRPTPGSPDAFSTCDPGALHIGDYWYVGYTSTTNSGGLANNVFVARATSPAGPFAKWDGTGWGGTPVPILTYTGDPQYYGYGEPSLVVVGTQLFLYYTDNEAISATNLATAQIAADDWPAHLVDHGRALLRARNAEDSADVKYVDALSEFVAVTTYDRFSPNASIAAYTSKDGLAFVPAAFLGARVQVGAHNCGISGDGRGHLLESGSNFVGYAYQEASGGWGNWPTHLDPIQLTTEPLGTATGGSVSSIVDGKDWGWSGPRAWDGDPTTVFSSVAHGATATAEEWVVVDVGATARLTGVRLDTRPGGLGFPVDFAIQTSADNLAWTDVPGQSYQAFPTPSITPFDLSFAAPVSARYLRLHATTLGSDDGGGHYLQLAEITPRVAAP